MAKTRPHPDGYPLMHRVAPAPDWSCWTFARLADAGRRMKGMNGHLDAITQVVGTARPPLGNASPTPVEGMFGVATVELG